MKRSLPKPLQLRAAVLAGAVTACCAALTPAAMAQPTVHVGASGGTNAKELTKTIPIGRQPGNKSRVVLSVPPSQLGDVQQGDRVEGLGEVEVSVTCLEPSRQCVGRPYGFSPHMRLGLFLSGDAKGAGGTQVGKWKRVTCSQNLPNRNHHCTYTIDRSLVAGNKGPVPCAPGGCHLNLVASAYHTHAHSRDVLVVGSDQSDGSISQGKGRLSSVVYRPGDLSGFPPAKNPIETRARRIHNLPIASHSHSTLGHQVVYSLRLPSLKQGEQLVVHAHASAAIGHLPFNVLFQSQLVLSEHPGSAKRNGVPHAIASTEATFTPLNGFNCTQGRSPFNDPCAIDKVGVIKIFRNARTKPRHNLGPDVPLYINFVIGGAAEFDGQAGSYRPGDAAHMRGTGYIKAYRYSPFYSR